MKKYIMIFLIIITTIFIPKLVNAKSFYEAEYIDGIYMNKLTPDRKTIYYQKARFFRDSDTGEYAYCIEPFAFFYGGDYESNITPYNLSEAQKQRISLIAHFGYGYQNHQEPKWYAITQFMIWETAEPNGTYYFTDTLNGNKIYPYNNEINEINNLIDNYQKNISFNNKHYDLIENESLTITDDNQVLANYSTNNKYVSINNNKLTINTPPTGNQEITLIYQDNYYNKPLIFYQSYNSQNLLENGDLNNKSAEITISVQTTSLTINKLDKDTASTTSSGEGNLSGAIYELFDQNMNKLQTLEIIDSIATIKNLSYGKYYLKEVAAGTGYSIDDNTYEFTITKDNPNITLNLYNEIIKGTLIINKQYESSKNYYEAEPNVTFEVYNHNNELVETIITDENGHIEINLPYGTYTIKQKDSTEGYEIIEPFNIIINSNETLTYNLVDYKIPDTKTSIYQYILNIIRKYLCIK